MKPAKSLTRCCYDTLKRTGYVGVAKIAMHNREHIVIFRPGAHGLLMHTMYYANEVRQVEEFRTDTGLVKEQELKLAEMLVESLAAPFEPQKYHDTYLRQFAGADRRQDQGPGSGDSAAPPSRPR